MSGLGKLVVDLAANTASFQSEMTKASRVMQRRMAAMQRHTQKLTNGLNLIGSAARIGLGVVGVSSVALFGDELLATADKSAKMARRFKVSVEAFTSFRPVVEKSGIAFDNFGTAMQRLLRRSDEAANGTGEAVKAFREMGIDAEKFSKLGLEDKVLALADAFDGMQDGGEQLRLIVKLADTEGAALLQMFEGGSEGVEKLLEKHRSYGDYLSKDGADAIEKFNDHMADMDSWFRGTAIERIGAATKELNGFIDAFKAFDFQRDMPNVARLWDKFQLYGADVNIGALDFFGFDKQADKAREFRDGVIDRLAGAELGLNGPLSGTLRAMDDVKEKADAAGSALAKVFNPEIKAGFDAEERLKKQAETLKKMAAFVKSFVLPDLERQAELASGGVGVQIDRARTFLGASSVTAGNNPATERLDRIRGVLEQIEINTARSQLAEVLA